MKTGSLLCCIFNLQGQSWNLRAPRVVLSEIGRNQISWQSEPLQARDIASSPEFHQRHIDYPTSYEWRRICVHLWEKLWLTRSCRYRSQKSKLIRNCETKFFFEGEFPSPSLRTSPSPPLEAEPVIIVIIMIIIILVIIVLIIIVLITSPWALTSSSWSA